MKRSAQTGGGRNGHKLPFPFPGALGTADDPACGPPDPSIDRSEFGRMVLNARRKGIDICPRRLEPVGRAFEAYAGIFEFRPDPEETPAPAPVTDGPVSVPGKVIRALGHLTGIIAALMVLFLLVRGCLS
jgi:hypothetical protein